MTASTLPTDASVEDESLAVRDTLPITRRSRGSARLTIALFVMFGISAGFLVGVLIGKDHGNSSSTSGGAGSFAALAQQFGGAGAAPGAGGGGAGVAGVEEPASAVVRPVRSSSSTAPTSMSSTLRATP